MFDGDSSCNGEVNGSSLKSQATAARGTNWEVDGNSASLGFSQQQGSMAAQRFTFPDSVLPRSSLQPETVLPFVDSTANGEFNEQEFKDRGWAHEAITLWL